MRSPPARLTWFNHSFTVSRRFSVEAFIAGLFALLALLHLSSAQVKIFAGSSNGNVFSIDPSSLAVTPLVDSDSGCSYLAVRPSDGVALGLSDSLNPPIIAVFNAFTGTSISQ